MTTDISQELRDGIKAYYERVARLGGFGVRVVATMRDGSVRTGLLGEASSCQPVVCQADGRRFVVNLDHVVVADGDDC